MSDASSSERASSGRGPYEREPLRVDRPIRSPGGFYRTAENDARTLGGVPLTSVEDAATAAIRMAYKVAENQIDRSSRLARRLRDAGDRAVGAPSGRKALDATERLVFKSMMSGLGWLEGLAAESGSPLKRLASTEFRLLGQLLGLLAEDGPAAAGAPSPSAASPASWQPPRDAEPTQGNGGRQGVPKPSRNAAATLQIKHVGAQKRAVRVVAFELAREPETERRSYDLVFYGATPAGGNRVLDGSVLVVPPRRAARLEVRATGRTHAGRWLAAVCSADGMQIGIVEIEL